MEGVGKETPLPHALPFSLYSLPFLLYITHSSHASALSRHGISGVSEGRREVKLVL